MFEREQVSRKGLEDSLKGRFELIRSPHWSYRECAEAFDFTLDDFLFFGSFPGAARFKDDKGSLWGAHRRMPEGFNPLVR